ncbi:hypothetical protein ACFQZI_03280 [Mucilaginibacter lutimaris]|uniref:Capsule polysaccharide biosynthesis protein n=1 Tax=Mucilaginibacter lutimaris TaxID=931629 RepID=A0ABW2ZB26_9SPHI
MKNEKALNSSIISKAKRIVKNLIESKKLYDAYKDVKSPPASKGNILLYSGIGYMYLTPLEIMMYHLLKLEGYNVDYLIYDEAVPLNELITKRILNDVGKDTFWNDLVKTARRWLKSANVKYQYINFPKEIDVMIAPVKNNLDEILKFKYDGIDFGDIVLGVMYRFYKSTNFEADAAERAAEFLKTALANYMQVKSLCQKKEYKYVMFSHGIYCTWQPVAEYCVRNNIKYICYDRGKRNASTNFNVNQPSPDWSFDTAWDRYADKQLTPKEHDMVQEYMVDRELQKGDVYSYNPAPREADVLAVKNKLGIKPDAKVITIFTNLIWDAANVARDIAFPSALNCIEQTINYFKDNPSVHVLVRSHPAEKVLGTNERYGNLIREKFNNQLPANVSVIDPEMDINSFTVIDMSDIGVVNTSTVGLEFAMMAKPIVLISETHYRNKGFTYDPVNTAQYFEMLEKLLVNNDLLENQAQLAQKYFYMMMFLYQKNIPVKFKHGKFNGYTFNNLKSINQTDSIVQIIKSLDNPNLQDFIFWD